MRRHDTWQKAYGDYTYPNLPIIKAISEAIAEKENQKPLKPTPLIDVEVVEVAEVAKTEKSSSTLEETSKLVPSTGHLARTDRVDELTRSNPYDFDVLEVDLGVLLTPQQPLPDRTMPPHKRDLLPDMGKLTIVQWRGLPLKVSVKFSSIQRRERSPPRYKNATP